MGKCMRHPCHERMGANGAGAGREYRCPPRIYGRKTRPCDGMSRNDQHSPSRKKLAGGSLGPACGSPFAAASSPVRCHSRICPRKATTPNNVADLPRPTPSAMSIPPLSVLRCS